MILSTIHSAKGQSVYVLNVVDGCIPSDMSTGTAEEIEEERRLLYVAMTRARERLQLVVPQRFYVHQQTGMGDRHVYASRASSPTPCCRCSITCPKAPPLPGNARARRRRRRASMWRVGCGACFPSALSARWVKNSPTRLGAFKESSLVGR